MSILLRKGGDPFGSLPRLQAWRKFLSLNTKRPDESREMITPGARGYGIIPWVLDLSGCGCGNQHPIWETTGNNPYLVPAFVTWYSPLDATENIHYKVMDRYAPARRLGVDHDNVNVPMLTVETISHPDEGDGFMATPFNQGFVGDFSQHNHGVPESLGLGVLAPTWSITPVNEELWRVWRAESQRAWEHEFPWLSRWASIAWSAGSSDLHDLHSEDCFEEPIPDDEYGNWQINCQCGLRELGKRADDDLAADTLNNIIATERNAWDDAWDHAKERHRLGWGVCNEHAIDTKDYSANSFGQDFSPFWLADTVTSVRNGKDAKHLWQRDYFWFSKVVSDEVEDKENKVGDAFDEIAANEPSSYGYELSNALPSDCR